MEMSPIGPPHAQVNGSGSTGLSHCMPSPEAPMSPSTLQGLGHYDAVEPLLLIGSGGLALDVLSIIDAINEHEQRWKVVGFLDDNPAKHGGVRGGVPVLGPVEAAADFPDARVVTCISGPESHFVRAEIVDRLRFEPERYGTLIHPQAQLAPHCDVGHGSIVFAGATVTAPLPVGSHVILRPNVVVSHEDEIEDYVSIGAGAVLAGHVTIKKSAYVGAGSSIRGYITIGEGALVGMGAAVLNDVGPFEVWVGNPARYLRPVRH